MRRTLSTMAAGIAVLVAVLVVPNTAHGVLQPGTAAGPTGAGAAPACTSSQLAKTTSTDQQSYKRGTPVGVSTSLTNVSNQTCRVHLQACISATITNAQGTVVWSAVPLNALCAMYIVSQKLRPGAAVTRSWSWNQHVCLFIGSCPGALVPAGTYTAQGHWGVEGDASPATFLIVR
ncbi:MAG: hypothetical protein JO086_16940 [Acidimicrobiia bacterium]|nr:hypothetical protein [Acidimicrobiia bacterium]